MQRSADELEYSITFLRFARWMYKYIADGIAWRAFSYNREIIRALGDKEPVSFLADREKINEEIRIFKAIRHLGEHWLPVMHDLTNCLRTADFSIFHQRVLKRIFELKIKSSDRVRTEKEEITHNKRTLRQIDRLDQYYLQVE